MTFSGRRAAREMAISLILPASEIGSSEYRQRNRLFTCALEQRGFLCDKGDHFAVFSNIKFGDVTAIAQNLPLLNFVEAKSYN